MLEIKSVIKEIEFMQLYRIALYSYHKDFIDWAHLTPVVPVWYQVTRALIQYEDVILPV